MAKSNVLFLCTGNSCRSQMAEGLLRELAGDSFNVLSAGTNPAECVHPIAIEVMGERGINVSEQRPKSVDEYLGQIPVRHLIIVCEGADGTCPRIFPGMMNRHLWPFDDPAAFVGSAQAKKERFRTVRDQIETRLKNWLEQEL